VQKKKEEEISAYRCDPFERNEKKDSREMLLFEDPESENKVGRGEAPEKKKGKKTKKGKEGAKRRLLNSRRGGPTGNGREKKETNLPISHL